MLPSSLEEESRPTTAGREGSRANSHEMDACESDGESDGESGGGEEEEGDEEREEARGAGNDGVSAEDAATCAIRVLSSPCLPALPACPAAAPTPRSNACRAPSLR